MNIINTGDLMPAHVNEDVRLILNLITTHMIN